ncbi:hypothetical protein R1sor_006862 [Riccia sorocarpa]|uniref:Pirin n=1 Tax=Riccia sorocarpa TaxID=122646 RepID=A0ABD3HQJ6_9MARC
MLRHFLQPTPFVSHLTGSLRAAAAAPSKSQFTPRGIRPRFASASLESSDMSLKHIPAKNLTVSTPTSWLESRFHFSFAEYYNPANTEFGVLRVLNDDLVKPRKGFGTHPHRDMEICTYVVDGKLTHKDSMGTAESLGRGSVQYMSAGTGVTHSEMNDDNELLRFLQIWIKPNARGLKPNYGSRVWRKEDRHNQLQHVVTDFKKLECAEDQHTGVIPIHQDVNMYVSEADQGVSQTFTLQKKRQAYLVCIEGNLSVNGTNMSARDAMEVRGKKDSEFQLELKADTSGAHFFMIEMALA